MVPDETYLRGRRAVDPLCRAIDQHGQVIDVMLAALRDLAAARRLFTRALRAGTIPAEVTTDRAPAYPRVLDELIPSALHTVEQYAKNPTETDHGRLKARLRPMRGPAAVCGWVAWPARWRRPAICSPSPCLGRIVDGAGC